MNGSLHRVPESRQTSRLLWDSLYLLSVTTLLTGALLQGYLPWQIGAVLLTATVAFRAMARLTGGLSDVVYRHVQDRVLWEEAGRNPGIKFHSCNAPLMQCAPRALVTPLEQNPENGISFHQRVHCYGDPWDGGERTSFESEQRIFVKLFWWFVPLEWWPLIGLGLLVGWLIGVVRLRTLVAVGTLIVLWPYIEAWLGGLPMGVQYALAGLVVLAFLRDLLAFFLGDQAADHAIGEFVGYLLKVAFWTLGLPFRAAGWLIRRALTLMERTRTL